MSHKEGNKEILEKMDDSDMFDEDANKNLECQEINSEEHDVIKGDTVGKTVYSAKWILNTLMSLLKIYEEGWNESIENDLCILWDMTGEEDIVEFLLENDFYKMAHFALKTSEEPRQTEIIIGIIGNMCCETKSLEILVNTDELVTIILSLISTDDKETLIQVLRILQAAIWDIKNNSLSPWLKKIKECQILGESVTFILKSSTSEELLTPTIDFVYLISDIELNNFDLLERIFDIDSLIFALSESMIELIDQKENSHSERQLKNIENWFNILFNIMKRNLLKFVDDENDENFKKINIVLLKILQPYEDLSNLMPSEEKVLLCIHHCIKMVLSLEKNDMHLTPDLIHCILRVMVNLETAATEDDFEDCDDFKELYQYAASYWIEILKNSDKQEIQKILELCDNKTVNNIEKVTTSLSTVPEHCIAKFLEAKSMPST